MILEMQRSPRKVLEKARPSRVRRVNLWPQLSSDTQRQLALSWANLIVHMREQPSVEVRDERALPR